MLRRACHFFLKDRAAPGAVEFRMKLGEHG